MKAPTGAGDLYSENRAGLTFQNIERKANLKGGEFRMKVLLKIIFVERGSERVFISIERVCEEHCSLRA